MNNAIGGDIEELVLSGKLFNPPSRSSSPVRSRSPSPKPAQWPNPNSDEEFEYDSDEERRRQIEQITKGSDQHDSVGMGVTGRTGVKGVIRDRNEVAAMHKVKRAQEIKDLNKAMEKASLGGKTWAEEERERIAEQARLEGKPLNSSDGLPRKGRFGHLREVGMRGYVQAVEQEEKHVWVLVHIYDPSLDRCATIDETLARLARSYPNVKFLRARAGAIGFATSATSSRSRHLQPRAPFTLTRTPSRRILVPGRYPAEEDDEDEDDSEGEGSEDEGWGDDAVDTDVLPTMLAYRAGELVHTWVRVDWEATMGLEEFLRRHHILSDSSSNGNLGFPSDDEDFDLDDGELVFGGSDDD
ncbi:hypothetical protein C8Q75DRAFT_730869 [Abortiporus biennis]|nr:hypothetical protein C8Q75DRAFT_730869 [Abortiporus biennis]